MKIGTREIGPGLPCVVVAELSNSHNGSLDRALHMIDAAKASGADIVKLQAYTADELVALRGDGPAPEPWHRYSMRELYSKAATPLAWLPALFEHARDIGIPIFSSVFGPESLAALEAVGCPAYKISHFEAGCRSLAALVKETGKPVIVSVQRGLANASRGALTVWCPGAYPASLESMHLKSVGVASFGLSSHCLDPLVAPIAVARGARYLEYHFMLEDSPSELEANVSLTETQFASMVASVRRAEVLLG